MKKIILLTLALSMFTIVACNKKNDNAPKSTTTEGMQKAADKKNVGDIAIVDLDTLQEKYQFYIDEVKPVVDQLTGYQQQVTAKQNAIEQQQANFQQKVQNGGFASEAAAQAEYLKIQQATQSAQNYLSGLATKADAAQNKLGDLQDTFTKNIDDFLKDYCKEKGIRVVLPKSVMLYGDDAIDVTNEVLAGLNARYKKNKK